MSRVLFIQEDEALRRQVRAMLEAGGLAVDEAGTALAGIARALEAPPDLILVDVRLPDLSGSEATARLRREPSLAAVPILAMGGSLEERGAALAAGAVGFLGRAVDAALPDRLREFLAGEREALSPEREREALRALVGSMALRLEAALAGPRRPAERDQTKSSFIHNLAHELSTPLTPLSGYVRILQSEKTGALDPQQRRIVESMASAVGRLTRIVDNLSDFASLQAGHTPMVEAEVSPDALVDEVAGEYRSAIRDARLHLHVLRSGSGPVLADGRKLRQALSNLVSNAVKFSPHGAELLIEVEAAPERLRFLVYDQGPGIRPEELEQIFEPLHHAATRVGDGPRAPGSGLGLPVARRIAEAHGGSVRVESPPASQPPAVSQHYTGSRFVLEVRVRPAAPGAPAPGAARG
jgi:signal transduction histidine kinase